MKERDFQTKFKHWIEDNQNLFGTSKAFELKIVKGKSMRFDRVVKHQRRALYDAKHNFLYWKIPDSNFLRKPFDCFVLIKAQAFVTIWFYKPREKKELVLIDIDDFIWAMFNFRPRKSLKEHELKKLAWGIYEFK